MKEITTVGLDLAKNVFQVHAVDAAGAPVVRRQLRRTQVLLFFSRLRSCLIGMEACAGSHYWARELTRLGHEVRLIPPSYVKPFVRRWPRRMRRMRKPSASPWCSRRCVSCRSRPSFNRQC